MYREYNTNTQGGAFAEDVKVAVWTKALGVPNHDLADWRQDICGVKIRWSDYGDTTDRGFGWEIDHILPVAHGGTDDINNLQPLQWQNNRRKGDTIGRFQCALVAPPSPNF